MTQGKRNAIFAVAAGLSSALFLSPATNAAMMSRINGTVESLDGSTLKLKSQDGKEVTVALSSDWTVKGRYKATSADIKPGDFVGIANEKGAGGANNAIQVVVFPASMKGTGEGDRPWSGKANSSMTNATVASAVKSVDGPKLTLTYKGGEKTITIPAGTPILALGPADKKDVKAGATVMVIGEAGSDGSVTAKMIQVDESGPLPAGTN